VFDFKLTHYRHKAYLSAVEDAFGSEIDYSMLVKMYGNPTGIEYHYSPPVCAGCATLAVSGHPDPADVSGTTSFVERQNLTMRMQMRRYARLTDAISKNVSRLEHAVALHYMH